MARPLVIVESPAKARTIAGYLGRDYVVESSVGHIRDLPKKPAEIPAAYKDEKWARLGVDVDNDFRPLYVLLKEKKDVVANLRRLLKESDELYLATDEDREGESIAWHLIQELKPRVPVKRMVFHEITPKAIRDAVDHPRDLNQNLVDAQETRRILDRLYGYEVSPVLWKKVLPRLSAGRVQSVATRLVVDRERQRWRFRSAGYADISGTFATARQEEFGATLVAVDRKRVATGRDFDSHGELRQAVAAGQAVAADVVRLDRAAAEGLARRLADRPFAVRSVEEKPYRRTPYAPFMTSTLQQEAGRKLRFSAARAMSVAQRLYENGYITYMRTDSTTLSETAIAAARSQAAELYGREYVPAQPRRYEKKVRNAQEAHEAIRPAGDTFRTPSQVSGELRGDEFALYDLIWKRTVASQMADAQGRSLQVRLGATSTAGEDAEFAAAGKVIEFPGFLRAYVEGSDDPEAALEDREVRLPALAAADPLTAVALEAQAHATQPPPRYTEASLVKALEEQGVGRPSTYATIIGTIQDRGYVWKKGAALVPSFVAFAVIALLEEHFGELVDYAFTARMEDELDDIASGHKQRVPWLKGFYFGDNGGGGLKTLIDERLEKIDARAVNSIEIPGTSEIVVRVGQYGPYLQRGEERASIPENQPPDELTVARAEELLSAPSGDRVVGTDPASGLAVLVRNGRFGPYVQLGEAGDAKQKPRTSSLFKSMTVEGVTLEQALQLLELPRAVGADPADGVEVTAKNGKYGPYVEKASETRSLESEEQLFSVTLEEALALLSQPKARRGAGGAGGAGGRAAAAGPLKDLGPDPSGGANIVVRDGRFGPYVTDGTVNASLRKADSVEEITRERALELLAEKRAKGPPAPKKRGARSAARSKRVS